MVILRLSGGLGNQMFEYALYLALRERGREVLIDDASDYSAADRRPVQLWVHGLDYPRATKAQITAYTDASMAMKDRVRRKLTGRRSLAYRETEMAYDPTVFERDPVYLEGFFQSERYFKGVSAKVREAYSFQALERMGFAPAGGKRRASGAAGAVEGVAPGINEFRAAPESMEGIPPEKNGDGVMAGQMPSAGLLKRYLDYEAGILSCRCPVGVHVRRGDYLDAKHEGIYEGICTKAYYEEAMERVRGRYPDARFYIFTNDADWVRTHLAGPDRVVIEGGGEEAGYLELYLMSRCAHQIIANSSFSWWGAWLNPNPAKMVIAPSRWLNGSVCPDIYTEDMLRM